MSDLQVSVLTLIAFRALSCLSGVFLVYIGYRLFMKGIYGNAGDVDAVWGNRKLLIKKAAPGTLFSVAGAVVLGIAFAQSPSVELDRSAPAPQPIPLAVRGVLLKVAAGDALTDSDKATAREAVLGTAQSVGSSDSNSSLGNAIETRIQVSPRADRN